MKSINIVAIGIFALVAFGQAASAQDFTGGTAVGIGGPTSDEQLYPYDSQEPWLHGYFQRIPFHGGFRTFRPYNYRHVLSQSQTAAGWGMSPQMPYSQQFWHQFEAESKFAPYQSKTAPTQAPTPMPIQNHMMMQPGVPMVPQMMPVPSVNNFQTRAAYPALPRSAYQQQMPAPMMQVR